MKATRFESHHQTLLHLMVLGLAVATYLRNRVDIVWAVVRGHHDSASWERLIFGIGAALLAGSAALETWVNAQRRMSQAGMLFARVLLVLAVGLLLPTAGTIILFAGETILIARLALGNAGDLRGRGNWGSALRVASARWGLTASMVVFAWTLQDRIAEAGVV